jgi:sulfite exporter TauE/SafE
MNPIAAGLTMGLLGSLHCIGMCGPLMLALPPAGATRTRFLLGRFACQAGRVLTYVAMGIVFGLFGKTLAMAGWQRGLSIFAGVALIAAVALRGSRWSAQASGLIGQALARLRRSFGPLLQRRTTSAMFGIGLLNGLLPCGLVYIALAGAAATGSGSGGATFMAAFGFGTVPAMLGISLAGRMIQPTWRMRIQRAVPVAMVVLATLFILRGLNLGIPYISPDLSPASAQNGFGCCAH